MSEPPEDLRKANLISILNMKAGDGKTTLTCNLAVELARKNHSVLVVDIDPQFNSTQTLIKYFTGNLALYNQISDNGFTIKSIFDSSRPTTVVSQPKSQKIDGQNKEIPSIFTLRKEETSVDLIAGDLRLIVDINAASRDRFQGFFNRKHLRSSYEYILIDCPPTWGELTSVALSTSNYYLIPTTLDDFSSIGISILRDQLSNKVDALEPNTLNCLGVAYTFLNKTTAQDGIARSQKHVKKTVEIFFNNMSKDLHTPVNPFETLFYRDNRFVASSAIYRDEKNLAKNPQYAEKAAEFADEVIQRTTQETVI